MKKIFKLAYALILASALAFSAFGCTSNNDNKNPSDVNSGEVDNEQSEEKPEDKPGQTPETPEENPEDTEQEESQPLTYNQKIGRFMDGMQSTAFTTYVANLAEYDFNASIALNAIYASPNGNGDGSKANPYSLQDGLDEVQKGQTLYLLGGTYTTSDNEGWFVGCKGEANNYITIRNYPGEKVTLTNSYTGKEAYGFQFDNTAQYIIMEGLEFSNIQSKAAKGIAFWGDGQNNIVIRNCDFHDIKTTSANPETDSDAGVNTILLMGETANSVHDIAIIYNHCYNLVNGWSENISVAGNCERVYVIGNLVENCTNIGIDFYGNAGYCSTPSLDQPRDCLAAGNTVKNCNCLYADCAGLYVDGARNILLQNNFVSGCAYGIEIGSEEKNDNYPVNNITVRSNICASNNLTGIRIGGYEEVETGVVKSTYIYNNTFTDNGAEGGAGIILAKIDGVEFVNNIITVPAGVRLVSTDFTEEYTKNFTFNNNLFYVCGSDESEASFKICGNRFKGFSTFNASYGNSNFYSDPRLDGTYMPTNAYSGESLINFGKYDYHLNEWPQTPLIGAVAG